MPSNTQLVAGVIVSAAITVGGAWLASATSFAPETSGTLSYPSGLNVTFNGVRNDKGNVIVMVFADRTSFKSYNVEKAVGYQELASNQGKVSARFPDLKQGPYAIAAFHDEDQNRDLNMQGEWPAEGYATSGAIDAYDTPTFARATIRHGDVTLKMYYAN